MSVRNFLNLIEQFDPNNETDPKWELYDFLQSKGVKVSMVRNTDLLYIDTGKRTIAVNLADNEEEAEGMNQEVQDIAGSTSPLKNQAAQIIKKKQTLAPKIVKKAGDQLKNLEKEVSRPTNIIR